MKKMRGNKENKRKMKENDSNMPFHLIFHYFMHPPRARAHGAADDKLSRGHERK